MTETETTYVGRLPCGCLVWAMIDGPRREKGETEKAIAEAIRYGMTVTKGTNAEVRQEIRWCTHQAASVMTADAKKAARAIMAGDA